ncbi:hypothetical protein [Saccharicrinis fermentans]|uniref:Uncharacterized protein n=1 Tax=Saccharicrinis fermentans DSM 9555 = JCM 21142 TaxID=869213 RepID=W7YRE8_9BACT|nr:hypothetical protein [Saccharicrinis fermentans]GAF05034.1 hypothetical protein JCM21142_93757 [Saccharicrinis fermentans DSM 9555 = JCM 21142]
MKAEKETKLEVQLRRSESSSNYTPEIILESKNISLKQGEQVIDFGFDATIKENSYAFITFMHNENVSIRESENLYSGVMSVFNGENEKVSNKGKQTPPEGIGVDSFEFWIPKRRPQGKNIAMKITPAIKLLKPKI